MNEIRKLLRGAFLALAVATGAAMLSATPSQAIPDEEGCNTVTALDMATGEYTECGYCQLWDSPICIYDCDNGDSGWFNCEGEFD